MMKILGLRVQRDCAVGTLKISQEGFINVILPRFGMQNANPVSTPLNHSVKLVIPIENENENDKLSINEPYTKVVGSLMYASLGT
jgi:hypothetical protein